MKRVYFRANFKDAVSVLSILYHRIAEWLLMLKWEWVCEGDSNCFPLTCLGVLWKHWKTYDIQFLSQNSNPGCPGHEADILPAVSLYLAKPLSLRRELFSGWCETEWTTGRFQKRNKGINFLWCFIKDFSCFVPYSTLQSLDIWWRLQKWGSITLDQWRHGL